MWDVYFRMETWCLVSNGLGILWITLWTSRKILTLILKMWTS